MPKAPIDAVLDGLDWKAAQLGQDAESVSDLPYATHEAVLNFCGFPLKVYMLNTGERVIDADDLREFFGGAFKDSEGQRETG